MFHVKRLADVDYLFHVKHGVCEDFASYVDVLRLRECADDVLDAPDGHQNKSGRSGLALTRGELRGE